MHNFQQPLIFFDLFFLTDYGPVQIKIEDESANEQYHNNNNNNNNNDGDEDHNATVSSCMIRSNSLLCKQEDCEEPTAKIRIPDLLSPEHTGHLSPSSVNIPLLSPRGPEDPYQIPSPCQIDYIEHARSPIYLPQVRDEHP